MVNSTVTMLILLGFYAVILLQAAWERNWYRDFLVAIIISLAVLGMTAKGKG